MSSSDAVEKQLLSHILKTYFPCNDTKSELVISTHLDSISRLLFSDALKKLPINSFLFSQEFINRFKWDNGEFIDHDLCANPYQFTDMTHLEIKQLIQKSGKPISYLFLSGTCLDNNCGKVYMIIERKVLSNYSAVGALFIKDKLGSYVLEKENYFSHS